jgi:hypothetical protein
MFVVSAIMSTFHYPRSGKRRVICSVLVALAIASNGCNFDECPRDAVRCNGKLAQECVPRGSDDPTLAWYTTDCGDGYCHLSTSSDPGDRDPFCAQTVEPDPNCAAKAGATDFLYCNGNEVIACHQGYVESTFDCSTGQTWGDAVRTGSPRTAWGYCVTMSTSVSCAVEPMPDPLCSNVPADTGVCDGNRLLICTDGYVVEAYPCPSTGTCVPNEHRAFCAMTSTPEAACPLDATGYYICKDGLVSQCEYGYVVYQQKPCPTGWTCSAAEQTCIKN